MYIWQSSVRGCHFYFRFVDYFDTLKVPFFMFFEALIVFTVCNITCVHVSRVKKHSIFHTIYFISIPLFSLSKKRVDDFLIL